jgi:hypothetical protein
MPNALKGETLLKLDDGRAFTLVLDHEALIEAETLYRKPLPILMSDASQGFAGACRALLYGALRAYHPAITAAEASALFFENMDEAGAALALAAEAGFPKPAEGKQDSHPRKAHPAGTRSGGNGAKSASTRKPSGGQRRASSR